MVKPFGGRDSIFHNLLSIASTLYRFIQSAEIMIEFNNFWWLFGNYCGPNVFDIRLQTMTESPWKILKV